MIRRPCPRRVLRHFCVGIRTLVGTGCAIGDLSEMYSAFASTHASPSCEEVAIPRFREPTSTLKLDLSSGIVLYET
jgi:hypothetical protein